jgi:DivIVA domain-containing protein
MPLTPNDVRYRRFSNARRGYPTEEVHEFLEAVASDYEDALRAIAQAAEDPVSARIASRVLQAATTSATRLLQEVEDEAAQIRHAAAREAAELKREAAAAADCIITAMALLQRARDRIAARNDELDRRVRLAQEAVDRAKGSLAHGRLPLDAHESG